MLDMVVPFSQRSTSPKKDSDNEDGKDKKKQAAVKETSGKKRKHKEEEEEDVAADGEIDEAEIERKGKSINIYSLILHNVCISCEQHILVHLF